MTKIGGSTFINCSVPIAFKGRYFILEPGNPPAFSVVLDLDGRPVFEVMKNKPSNNPLSEVSISGAGIITVSDKKTGRFLYKFRPDSETSIVFGRIDGGETFVKITDKLIITPNVTLDNCTFSGLATGIEIKEDGSTLIGGSRLPDSLLSLFRK